MKNHVCLLLVTMTMILFNLYGCASNEDPELNESFSPLSSEKIYSSSDSEYYNYYDAGVKTPVF